MAETCLKEKGNTRKIVNECMEFIPFYLAIRFLEGKAQLENKEAKGTFHKEITSIQV